MASPADTAIGVAQFQGVNVAFDKTFIGQNFLQKSDNWVPNQLYRLAKRRGTSLFQVLGSGMGRDVDTMLRTYDDSGNRYLYAIAIDSAGIGQLWMSTNDGVPVMVGPPYTTPNVRYGFAVLGNQLYIGNGVDVLRKTVLGALTDEALAPLPTTDDTGQTAVAATDTTSAGLFTGTYSYAWAVYDTLTKLWVSRGVARTLTLSSPNNSITFTSPSVLLAVNQTYHLFVTFPDAPIETAHDQTTAGLALSTAFVFRNVVFETTPIPIAEVTRTGRFLVAHRDRIWFAGDDSQKSRLFATSVIVPGLEQAIFDIGDFFPALANQPIGQGDGDSITGLAVATLTSTQTSPSSPLAIFKTNSTWFLLGDILDDPNAQLVQVSQEVGCIAQATIVATPIGIVFCGRQSVYLLPAALQEPIDLGWPIAPVIKTMPALTRGNAFAYYDEGFYKLAITPAGAAENVNEWWLDLRQPQRGQVTSQPSWWGPHTVVPMTTATVGSRDQQEIDRAFGALGGGTTIVELDQPTYNEAVTRHSIWNQGIWNVATWQSQLLAPIVSVLRTAGLDDGAPFARKLFERFRAFGSTDATTQLGVKIIVDDGDEVETGTGLLPGRANASIWNISIWNQARWGASRFSEMTDNASGDTGVVFNPRPLGHVAEVEVTHALPVNVELRDFELRYLPDTRPVA